MRLSLTIFIVLALSPLYGQLYQVSTGSIAFTSEAPLELIKARSGALKGLLNTESREFAFTIEIRTFEGFNNPLQQVHFNENYMESQIYPQATFTGKIIEDIDLSVPGSYEVRVKGQLSIHGVQRERILRSTIGRDAQDRLSVVCNFNVMLQEHAIRVPKIVQQKIAESIAVEVVAELDPRIQ